MLKAGAKQGIFIPVSRVNTAYEYYKKLLDHDAVLSDKQGLPGSKEDFMLNKLDADDDWRVNIVWTDIKEAGGHNDIEKRDSVNCPNREVPVRDHIFMSSQGRLREMC